LTTLLFDVANANILASFKCYLKYPCGVGNSVSVLAIAIMEKIQLPWQTAGTFFGTKASNLTRRQDTFLVANLRRWGRRNTASFLATRSSCRICTCRDCRWHFCGFVESSPGSKKKRH